ncbi:MAG: hypothetical protein M5R36_28180 [Deltaproteobacteria bacterium]|nr:hypothetical protein [Deltaproteobacteria bacterium]
MDKILAEKRDLFDAAARLAEAGGARIWLVGGIVRDAMLGRASKDADFAVDGDVFALAGAFAEATGGTLVPLHDDPPTARVSLRGVDYDFTALRGKTIERDLRARDVTINAIALPLSERGFGRPIDPTGGMKDIAGKTVRGIGAKIFRTIRCGRCVFTVSRHNWIFPRHPKRAVGRRARRAIYRAWRASASSPKSRICARRRGPLGRCGPRVTTACWRNLRRGSTANALWRGRCRRWRFSTGRPVWPPRFEISSRTIPRLPTRW